MNICVKELGVFFAFTLVSKYPHPLLVFLFILRQERNCGSYTVSLTIQSKNILKRTFDVQKKVQENLCFVFTSRRSFWSCGTFKLLENLNMI